MLKKKKLEFEIIDDKILTVADFDWFIDCIDAVYVRHSEMSVKNEYAIYIQQGSEIVELYFRTTDEMLILREYEKKDSRIKVIAQEINQGEVVAKYTAGKIAQAEYIATLDPDDYYALDFCETLYNAIIETKADMACCNMQHIRENGRITRNRILIYRFYFIS